MKFSSALADSSFKVESLMFNIGCLFVSLKILRGEIKFAQGKGRVRLTLDFFFLHLKNSQLITTLMHNAKKKIQKVNNYGFTPVVLRQKNKHVLPCIIEEHYINTPDDSRAIRIRS